MTKIITSAKDLVTKKTDTVNGFIEQAKEKSKDITKYTNILDYFFQNKNLIKDINIARQDKIIMQFLTAATMLSQKSLLYFSTDEQNLIISEIIDFSKFNDEQYLEKLKYQYLMNSGESLGGSMRNLIGQKAQNHFILNILKTLNDKGYKYNIVKNKKGKIVQISWNDRCIFFDKKPKIVGKSIDFIVVKGNSAINNDIENLDDYIICGELKGGVDPAGADEHWKTGLSALNRIDKVFNDYNKKRPILIFLGSAIASFMAGEIFHLLEKKWLGSAANINNNQQLQNIVNLIIEEQP
jgi:hypothetical protein